MTPADQIARLEAIATTAEKMRDAQKHYFRGRDPDWLARARALERALDQAIATYRRELAESKQGRLL